LGLGAKVKYLSTDGLGNVEKSVSRTQDLVNNKYFYKTIINEYAVEDTDEWHIGRLTKATVTHATSGSPSIVRASTFAYNDKGVLSQEVSNVGTAVSLTKSYAYDSYGNKISETLSGSGVATTTTSFSYSANANYKETPFNRYFHTDALGSITAITDDTGKVVERRSYEAFGKIRAMDYGINNNSLASNLTIVSNRGFTGHEQISELSGLIHMNARVYDSDIGRFLSADPVLQAPLDSQSYNRYSYVRNNPLKFTDPTGNSWWTKLRNKITKPFKKAWNWVKKNSRFVIATVAAIVTGGFLAPALLGAAGLGLSGVALAVGSGAAAGAVSGAISTGTLKGALKGALIGGLTAGAAYGVAELTSTVMGIDSATAHGASFLKNGLTKVTAFKTLGHGLARGAISKFQGDGFKAGFLSGISSGFDVGTKGYGGILGRTSIMAIAGGTFSVIGGGKFSNGAFGGAMTHLFNAEAKAYLMKGTDMNRIKEKAKYYTHDEKMARGLAIQQELKTYSEPMMAAGVTGIAVLTGGVVIEAGLALIGPYYATVSTIAVTGGVQSYYAPAPQLNYIGASAWIIGMVKKGAF